MVLVLAKLKFGSKVDASLYELVNSLDDAAGPGAPAAASKSAFVEQPTGDSAAALGPHAQHRSVKPPLASKAAGHVD